VRKCTTQELESLGLGAPVKPTVPSKMMEKLAIRPRLAAVQVCDTPPFPPSSGPAPSMCAHTHTHI
jgi:hypothetical protein